MYLCCWDISRTLTPEIPTCVEEDAASEDRTDGRGRSSCCSRTDPRWWRICRCNTACLQPENINHENISFYSSFKIYKGTGCPKKYWIFNRNSNVTTTVVSLSITIIIKSSILNHKSHQQLPYIVISHHPQMCTKLTVQLKNYSYFFYLEYLSQIFIICKDKE